MVDFFWQIMTDWPAGTVVFALFAVVFVFLLYLPFLLVRAAKEERQWRAFATTHHCREVARQRRAATLILIDNFPHWIPQPDDVCYQCDDGNTYWR